MPVLPALRNHVWQQLQSATREKNPQGWPSYIERSNNALCGHKRNEIICAMRSNYYALTIAIIKKYSVERSLDMMAVNKKTYDITLTEEDNKKITQLHQKGFKWHEIAGMYGLTTAAARQRAIRYMKKVGT